MVDEETRRDGSLESKSLLVEVQSSVFEFEYFIVALNYSWVLQGEPLGWGIAWFGGLKS
jgi:hypothetical protein